MQKANTLKALQLIHTAMLFGQIAFATIAIFLIHSNTFLPAYSLYNKVAQVIILSYSGLVSYIGIQVYFTSKVYAIKDAEATVKEKFIVFKKASIVKWACIESATLVSIIGFLLVGNYAFLALAFTLIILFAIMGASKAKLMLLLKFTEADIEEISNA